MAARVSLFPRGHGSVSTASISSWNQGGLEKGDQGMYRVVKVQYSYRVFALWVIYGRVWVPVWVQVRTQVLVALHIFVYMHTYACMHAHIQYIHMHTNIHTYTHGHTYAPQTDPDNPNLVPMMYLLFCSV